ncbi:MAG: SMP-30/gluconolactonase/LRE family protein [Geminicoccaceae bacterium]|nr:SMP-30/gluconolactonase/LRE family protein [Geminicoccaceae bacterium]MCS7267375.1 SMP-30/gluconolactonase/LRE family protein [Geminicoccaceae bacterium]MCX7630312.1 SMP-30/gluconolactonase/LRE family protein [Geminicoccaceae bacterium]MDW8123598.1 SMP-30/gluconolactonase/LRE family protein [Geminicoccaceae bacterium]MDW8339939.1 SMP-30/gluconolactonase/LRE family protein [Geminicoccaceae bacterium]
MVERIVEYEVHDRRFKRLASMNARVVKLWEGAAWAEGPVYFRDGDFLLFSDIPNDRILRFVPDLSGLGGTVSVFRQPAGYTNGHTRDREGRLVSCSHGHRRIERTEYDGTITVLADRWNGKRLNSPNDVVVKSDGTIWFTDPSYGIDSDLEGFRAPMEYGGCWVFRFDPRSGRLDPVICDMVRPNGLAFSPDEKFLYVADTGVSHDPEGPRHIRRFRVHEDGSLSGGEVFVACDVGVFDGFRLDTEGRLWTSAGDGVHCYDPSGALLGKILLPRRAANVCFGGKKKNRLFVCATDALYAVFTHVTGAQVP